MGRSDNENNFNLKDEEFQRLLDDLGVVIPSNKFSSPATLGAELSSLDAEFNTLETELSRFDEEFPDLENELSRFSTETNMEIFSPLDDSTEAYELSDFNQNLSDVFTSSHYGESQYTIEPTEENNLLLTETQEESIESSPLGGESSEANHPSPSNKRKRAGGEKPQKKQRNVYKKKVYVNKSSEEKFYLIFKDNGKYVDENPKVKIINGFYYVYRNDNTLDEVLLVPLLETDSIKKIETDRGYQEFVIKEKGYRPLYTLKKLNHMSRSKTMKEDNEVTTELKNDELLVPGQRVGEIDIDGGNKERKKVTRKDTLKGDDDVILKKSDNHYMTSKIWWSAEKNKQYYVTNDKGRFEPITFEKVTSDSEIFYVKNSRYVTRISDGKPIYVPVHKYNFINYYHLLCWHRGANVPPDADLTIEKDTGDNEIYAKRDGEDKCTQIFPKPKAPEKANLGVTTVYYPKPSSTPQLFPSTPKFTDGGLQNKFYLIYKSDDSYVGENNVIVKNKYGFYQAYRNNSPEDILLVYVTPDNSIKKLQLETGLQEFILKDTKYIPIYTVEKINEICESNQSLLNERKFK